MAFLLDANTIISFIKTSHENALGQLATKLDLCVVADVKEEIERRTTSKRWFTQAGIHVHEIAIGSPAHQTLTELGTPSARGLGERASIALAVHDRSLQFVTSDKNGMWIATRELHGTGGRFLSLASFLREARVAGMVWAAIDDAYREANLPQPTWWARWRAGKE